jgi:hypothetical protein
MHVDIIIYLARVKLNELSIKKQAKISLIDQVYFPIVKMPLN